MAISTATFISDVILFIRDILRDNITDPIVARTSGFIMTAFPKRNTQYPLITIRQTNIDTDKLGMQSELHLANIQLEIQIYARNSKESDNLSQNTIDILRTNQYGTSSTNIEEIHGFIVTSVVPIVETEGDNTIHRKVLTVNYKVILQG